MVDLVVGRAGALDAGEEDGDDDEDDDDHDHDDDQVGDDDHMVDLVGRAGVLDAGEEVEDGILSYITGLVRSPVST